MAFNEQVIEVFEQLVQKEKFSWEDVGVAVNAANIKVKNWLKVRGVMQRFFINTGRIKRTNDVFVEEYKVL